MKRAGAGSARGRLATLKIIPQRQNRATRIIDDKQLAGAAPTPSPASQLLRVEREMEQLEPYTNPGSNKFHLQPS